MLVKIPVYAYTESSTMCKIGEKYGMSEEAINMFRHFEEVALELEVDPKTGVVETWRKAE